jgi:zeaxanthin glucosyltransferase
MKKVLFVILPSPSHYHASFSYAQKLKAQGNEICYVGTPQLEDTVLKEGFGFVRWYYTSEYKIQTFKAFFGVFLKSLADKTFFAVRKKDYSKNIEDVRSLILETNADEIFLDEHLSEYYLYFQDLKVNTSILCTKISSRKSAGIPPMDSYFIPSNSKFSNLFCEFLWQIKNLKDYVKEIIHKVAFFGQDECSFLNQYCLTEGIDLKSTLDNKNYFYPSIIGIERVILGARSFDYPWRTVLPTERYELYQINRNEEKYKTSIYLEFLSELEKPVNRNKYLLYFSFGTVTYEDENRVKLLLNKIIDIVNQRTDLLLIISKSNYTHEPVMHDRIYTFQYLPQLHLLSYCDLMITHGGHNSIKECIQKGVKMLVFPHMENNDQPGNAARVQFGGHGLKGNLEKDSVDTIATKIDELLSNTKLELKKKENFDKPINGINYNVFDQIVKYIS